LHFGGGRFVLIGGALSPPIVLGPVICPPFLGLSKFDRSIWETALAGPSPRNSFIFE
jgi:hypothetical protein